MEPQQVRRVAGRHHGDVAPGREFEAGQRREPRQDLEVPVPAGGEGVVAGEVTPDNILLSRAGAVKVADFGTSRFLEIAAHGTTVVGSPPYMAPEQFQGKAVFASDIYSLGITMYQMFTGVLPYNTPMPSDLDRLMKGELASPPKLKNPKLPKAISDIVMKAIAADISQRRGLVSLVGDCPRPTLWTFPYLPCLRHR